MGQAASRQVGQTIKNVATKTTRGGTTTPIKHPNAIPTAANPSGFTRGETGKDDPRDVQQAMYLQSQRKNDSNSPDMPPDLVKFLEDVGPVKQKIDKEFTSPRLLKDGESEQDIQKTINNRSVRRERMKMPLMGNDETFTTTRSTNFSHREEPIMQKDFGASNTQLFELLSQNSKDSTDQKSLVESFCTEKISGDNRTWTEKELFHHRELTTQAINAVDIPILLKDGDGNILGVFPDQIPPEEVKSMSLLSNKKAKLVLADLKERQLQLKTLAEKKPTRDRRQNRTTTAT